jgi:hypothetical protein
MFHLGSATTTTVARWCFRLLLLEEAAERTGYGHDDDKPGEVPEPFTLGNQ